MTEMIQDNTVVEETPEKTFTQEEVNAIVGKRLAEEREKREKERVAREKRMKEFEEQQRKRKEECEKITIALTNEGVS